MQAFKLPSASCSTCSSRRTARAARPPAAATAAAATARQHLSTASLQRSAASKQRQVVARVRIDDLDGSAQGNSTAAAEALQAYMQLEQSGELNSVTAGNIRLKYGMRRMDDGRVQLRKADGTWMQVKLDMELRGTILLRNIVDDTVFVLQTERLEQVDLSDDYLLFMLFASGEWEDGIMPIRIADEAGTVSTLEMSEQQFKDYVGLIKSLQEAEEEAMSVVQGEDGAIDVTAEAAPSNGNRQ